MVEIKPGVKIKDRYTLKQFKGSGTFGEVWLAYDEVLDCDIAVKIYISLDSNGVEEFKSEYITTRGISHPNLLTTTYFDIWEHHPFLVMKYCENGSTARMAGEIDEFTLWQFIHDVSAGLEYLHDLPEPIIHQDIKPDNILVSSENRYLITDFGISKKMRSTMRKQSRRAVGAGATAYMGPEKFDSLPATVKASDIWSLGVSIYELATGELPFNGLGGVMQKSGAELPVLDNKWSRELNMVMQSCLARETWDRPTAAQLVAYSDEILKGRIPAVTWNRVEDTASVDPTPDVEPDGGYGGDTGEDKKRRRNMWIGIAAFISIIVVAAVFYIADSGKGRKPIHEPIAEVVEEETVEVVDVDTVKAEPATVEPKTPKKEPTHIAEAEPKSKKQPETYNKPEKNKVDPPAADKASTLRAAVNSGDYRQVQALASQGYAPAYGPLARHYIATHNYSAAETYAKKAKAAGYSEGNAVLETLQKIGYYD